MPTIGVIGGSGFSSLFEEGDTRAVHTPYGAPSGPVTVGLVGTTEVAFLPRHGPHHELPPHRINYRANLWALRSMGVDAVIGPCAAGSLQPHVKPGDVVICDQLVDRTWSRPDSVYDGPLVVHVSFAEPYCPRLREAAAATVGQAGLGLHPTGTVVVIQGPRFSTRAESAWFRAQGWEVVNMTQYPEAYLARELEMCYVNLSLITDYDAGLEGVEGIAPVTFEAVMKVLQQNNDSFRGLLATLVARVNPGRDCQCRQALAGSHA